MKKHIPLLFCLLAIGVTLKAQSPNAIPYQGVARNAGGNILASQSIKLRITIHDITAGGTIVYKETHTTTTTALGLFNVNIGQGAPLSGSLDLVDWGAGLKFTQVELDPNGGSNYINMGTTKLNSVPYALYAQNGMPSGTFPGDMLYWNGTAWVSVGQGTTGQSLTYCDNIPTWGPCPIIIGGVYQGGIVAYILQPGDPGYDANVKHGLIAASSDQGTGIEWGCTGIEINGANGIAIGTGNQNTIDIMAGCASIPIAARLCGDLVLGGYGDWYLPSQDELTKLYLNKNAIGGFVNNIYWSSTELNSTTAFGLSFQDGIMFYLLKEFNFPNQTNVRAIRAF